MGEQYLTWAEIQKKYPKEWVLIDKPVDNPRTGQLAGGYVVMHSPDRTEIERRLLSLRDGELPVCAFLYTGPTTAEDDYLPTRSNLSRPNDRSIRPEQVAHRGRWLGDRSQPDAQAPAGHRHRGDWNADRHVHSCRAGIAVPPAARRRRLRAVTGGTTAPGVNARQLLVLGHTRTDFPVTAHDLPPALGYHGLLGLDFFLGLVLTIDCARGRVLLSSRRWQFWR
ncbi:MAG TPA: hypothetical protein VKE74_28290 [Gemmataceae bacterium]|nr:hypothetical protein [Gemmataceae bacterium]